MLAGQFIPFEVLPLRHPARFAGLHQASCAVGSLL
jgi:hypothetical protein